MIKGDVGLVIQILTLIVAVERGAVYAANAWRRKTKP
jgi:hypothetical protein